MTKAMIVGQAPSRRGDGRPFTGPSGQRLATLAGLLDYEDLTNHFDLRNLIDQVQPKNISGKGDQFDKNRANRRALQMLYEPRESTNIICAGHEVWRAFGNRPITKYFTSEDWWPRGPNTVITCWLFPHPSGISHFWNDHQNFLEASEFLRRFLIASPPNKR